MKERLNGDLVELAVSSLPDDAAGEAELRSLEETAARLSFAAPQLKPRPELREKLLSGLAGTQKPEAVQVWREWGQSAPKPIHVVASNEGAWEPLDVEGVRVKRLYVDPAHDTVSLLIQMDPGTEYPGHRHAGPEHCYVIAGDLEVGGVKLRAGDYQVANTDSVHTVTRTRGGCTLLIISSQHDELIA